ncbi:MULTISPECIES: glycosyltransferase family 4 protein [Methylococcus]|uniref:Glycosyltransferase family 4 protein n=1 Tax=Methylococcus capsulatus TaxID=414 RepID=A0ABZ2F6F0_METCP|nr:MULTISPECIES: glycosyltransferase family 4 protein [Methylococcus]MDF9392309.1 glycosyltransferase [Methylococcus capsulatus]
MRILALTRYDTLGASSRVRFYQYLPYLAESGIEIETSFFLSNAYLAALYGRHRRRLRHIIAAYFQRLSALCKARRFDLLWIEKELFPWLPALAETLLQRLGIPYVADYDDAVFHNYDRHRNPLFRALLGPKIDEVMRHAAVVVAGNPYLGERARQAGARRVEIVPSVIDLNRYPEPKLRPRDPAEPVRIGWIGTPSTAPFLRPVRIPLQRVADAPALRLVLIGAGDTDVGISGAERPAWSEQREHELLDTLDVGIMPLADLPWERGKCGYKLVQYMACGKPVIASPVGVNTEIVEHGVNGFLASNDGEWTEAITTLANDAVLRQRLGQAAREKVVRAYSLQSQLPRLQEILASTCPPPSRRRSRS